MIEGIKKDTAMSNDVKKNENDNFRTIQSTLNELNRLVKNKKEVEDEIPETSLVVPYQQTLPSVIEDEEFSDLCEKTAALQFNKQTVEQICVALSIDLKKYKEIATSQEFINIKKRIAEDQKVNILSKVLGQVDSAINALSELMETADEDKVRLNAAAIILEQASQLLEEQRISNPDITSVLQNATKDSEPVTVTLAQVIMKQRADRGLPK
jgi:hypothetical protein